MVDACEGPGFVSAAFRAKCVALRTWVEEHSGEFPLQEGQRQQEKTLGRWLKHVRQAWKAGILNRTQKEMLTSVSGFTVHPLPSQWEKTCGDLRAWLERNRTPEGWKYPSKNAKDVEEKRLGIWLDNHCRWEKA